MKFNFLLPKQPIFFDLFKKLSNDILEIARLLRKITRLNDLSKLNDHSLKAKEIEHHADDITHEIVDRLNRTFVTPFDREDIYTLTGELDDIIDRIENVIHNIEIFKVSPQEKFISDFAQLIEKDSEYLYELTDLMSLQKYSGKFKEIILKIHDIEDEGDELFLSTLSYIFENGLEPVKVIKIKDIVEDLERVIDKFQDASNTFEAILVKSQ